MTPIIRLHVNREKLNARFFLISSIEKFAEVGFNTGVRTDDHCNHVCG